MAFYYYNDSGAGFCENHPGSYTSCYDFCPAHALTSYSSYYPGEPEYFDGVPARYHTAFDYVPPQPIFSYSAATLSRSESITVDPAAYHGGSYHPSQTRVIVSYSNSEFNEPDTDFEEYDPTPYGGGYDPSLTYGKPLPPSEEICYPHSTGDRNMVRGHGNEDGSAESPAMDRVGEEKDVQAKETTNGNKTVPVETQEEARGSLLDHTEYGVKEEGNGPRGDKEEDVLKEGENLGYHPSVGYGSGFEKMMPPAPPGCGLDAWDICDGFSGYWPCLSRGRGMDHRPHEIANAECFGDYENQWQGTADYIFGSTDPYAERRHESERSSSGYCYDGYGHKEENQGEIYHKQVGYNGCLDMW